MSEISSAMSDEALRPQTLADILRQLDAARARITRLEEQLRLLSERHRLHTHLGDGVGKGDCYDRDALTPKPYLPPGY